MRSAFERFATENDFRLDPRTGLVFVDIGTSPETLGQFPEGYLNRPEARAYERVNPGWRANRCDVAFWFRFTPRNLLALLRESAAPGAGRARGPRAVDLEPASAGRSGALASDRNGVSTSARDRPPSGSCATWPFSRPDTPPRARPRGGAARSFAGRAARYSSSAASWASPQSASRWPRRRGATRLREHRSEKSGQVGSIEGHRGLLDVTVIRPVRMPIQGALRTRRRWRGR